MKRSLCLLLALLLTVSLLAPTARAADPQKITVICDNWDYTRPVSQFRFNIREQGVQLVEQPKFLYLTEDERQEEETGPLDPQKFYLLTLRLRMEQAPAAEPDITVNGRSPYYVILEGSEVFCEYQVSRHDKSDQFSVNVRDPIAYGQTTDTALEVTGGFNMNAAVRLHKGATPDAPVIEDRAAEVYQDGQSYLFEVTVLPERLGVGLEPSPDVYCDPLVYCEEWTEYNADGVPDAVRVYLRYDCVQEYKAQLYNGSGFSTCFILENGEERQDCKIHVGDRVTVRAEPYRNDYDFVCWRAYGVELTEEQLHSPEFTFIMPENDVSFWCRTQEYEFPFTDVHQEDWFYEDVMIAHRIGLINGLTDTAFGPRETCTRAQFLSILGRFGDLDSYEPEGSLPFRDVPVNAWYYKAVHLFYTAGLVSGKTATQFAPYDPITRAEAVTMIWRLLEQPEAQGNPASFKDVSRKAYYYDAVRFAVEAGIVKGVGGGHFSPNQPVTRAQTAAMIVRTLEVLAQSAPEA